MKVKLKGKIVLVLS